MIIRGPETPMTRAASMNVVSRSASTWPRMIRAPAAQVTSADHDHHRDEARSDHVGDDQQQQDRREAQHDVDEPHEARRRPGRRGSRR